VIRDTDISHMGSFAAFPIRVSACSVRISGTRQVNIFIERHQYLRPKTRLTAQGTEGSMNGFMGSSR